MADEFDKSGEPKLTSGPLVVWLSVGIALVWTAFLLYFGYGVDTGG